MHPIVLLALGAMGGWAAYKWLAKPEEKLPEKPKENVEKSASPHIREADDLEPDPKTGVYEKKEN
ncbi:MAG: hypothetical protein ACRBBN_08360 [Methyloligellaceae bacterium]